MKQCISLLLLAFAGTTALAQTQGVSKDEIVLGTIQDLSGPLASYGKDQLDGMKLRISEINEQGGVHGRKLKLLAEDGAYDPRKSALAAQKLVNQDKVFMMVGSLGTVTNLAAMPIQLSKNVINFMPTSNSREMHEPVHPLKWAFGPSEYDVNRLLVPALYREKQASKACALYQDDESGLEVLRGAEAFYPAVSATPPYLDDASQPIRFWASKYRTAHGTDPSVVSVFGYAIVDRLVSALQKTGPQLTTDSFVRTMESFTSTEVF